MSNNDCRIYTEQDSAVILINSIRWPPAGLSLPTNMQEHELTTQPCVLAGKDPFLHVHLNPTEQTCNTVGFRQFIVAYNTYLHRMVILTKYNLVENLGP